MHQNRWRPLRNSPISPSRISSGRLGSAGRIASRPRALSDPTFLPTLTHPTKACPLQYPIVFCRSTRSLPTLYPIYILFFPTLDNLDNGLPSIAFVGFASCVLRNTLYFTLTFILPIHTSDTTYIMV